MKILTSREAQEFLKFNTHANFMDHVRKGNIPGKKIGGHWRFVEEELIRYLTEPTQIKKQDKYEGIRKWRCENVETPTGLISGTMLPGYANLLARQTKSKHKNYTIN